MENNTKTIYERLAAYLAGELDSQSREEIETWIKKSAENTSLFLQVEKAWKEAGKHDFTEINAEESWEKLSSKLDTPINKNTGRQLFFPRSWIWKVAASVLLVCLSYFLVVTIRNSSTETVKFYAEKSDTSFDLPDGSTVVLRKGSSIAFNEKFQKAGRHVSLSGEGFFEIKRDPDNPFTISTGNTLTKVLGTSFVLAEDTIANSVSLVVITGKVSFSLSGEESRIFEKGQSALATENIQSIYDPNLASWITGRMTFKETPAKNVLKTLQNTFRVSFEDKNSVLGNCLLTAEIDHMELTEVLELLEFTWEVDFENDSNGYNISGKGCLTNSSTPN